MEVHHHPHVEKKNFKAYFRIAQAVVTVEQSQTK